jgi:uncharacterized protein (TIGR02421 family)
VITGASCILDFVTPERLRELNDRLIEVGRDVRVLGSLTWPEGAVQGFLESWRKKDPKLPEVSLARSEHHEEREELEAIIAAIDDRDPCGRFLAETARSYLIAAEMLASIGTPAFTDRSRLLYGAPGDRLPGATLSHREAAKMMLETTDNLTAAGVIEEAEICLTAETVAAELDAAFKKFFGEDAPEVVIDDDLASKAAAGWRRVRIRAQTAFTELDVAQLIEHEGFVHTATALNGRAQPILSCMGLSSPRSTLTQEGIATLAELTTRAIDIARLRRLALRTVAIQRALDGADYLDVFRFFLEAGQSEDESAHSAMRIFRSGDVRGGIVFTKDVVYLCGLTAVHTFLRKAIAENRAHLVRRLFAGRMALPDVLRLDEAFAENRVIEPRFVPAWARDLHRLAAYLAFSAVINRINLGSVSLDSLLATM